MVFLGVASIRKELLDKCCLRVFLVKSTVKVSLDEVRNIIQYQLADEGSNEHHTSTHAVVAFELFLLRLSQGNFEGINLNDFLTFSIGVDRVPIFGLSKKLEIFFVNDDKLPRFSTCGLFMQVPKNSLEERLVYALRNCVGFGLL